MDTKRVRFLRQRVVTDIKSQDLIMMEFSYDDGVDRAPRFFGVPDQDLPKALALYTEWGGLRPDGYRGSITVTMP